jgi:hypothetical protein
LLIIYENIVINNASVKQVFMNLGYFEELVVGFLPFDLGLRQSIRIGK